MLTSSISRSSIRSLICPISMVISRSRGAIRQSFTRSDTNVPSFFLTISPLDDRAFRLSRMVDLPTEYISANTISVGSRSPAFIWVVIMSSSFLLTVSDNVSFLFLVSIKHQPPYHQFVLLYIEYPPSTIRPIVVVHIFLLVLLYQYLFYIYLMLFFVV